jgi:predicted small secreted protein
VTPTPARTVTPTRGRTRHAALVGFALVAVLLLAACSTVRGIIDTQSALERAGFTDVEIGFSSDEGFDRVEVTVRPEAGEVGVDDPAEDAARVVWSTFPLRFDQLRVDLLGPRSGTTTYTSGEMAAIFGPRRPGLDDKALGDDLVRTGVGIAVVLVVGGILFLAAVVIAVVMGVRTSRRRQSRTPPPWPPVVGGHSP